ncbi:MAG: BrnT family toxin [Thermomicrobiales bacterium]|jgi:uncharacterized DUF497 family protein
MEFEWDENKRQSNLVKHGIDFEDATQVFDGRPTHTMASTFQFENRQLTVGRLSGKFVTIVWTKRGETTRIISARRARATELTLLLSS